MRESRDIVSAWRRLSPGEEAVLATVVATSGSTYRRPGARMLLTREGWMAGSISGGCLESDALRTAWDRTADGPALATYDATADEDIVWGFGLGCNGVVQVLFERLPADGGPLSFLERTLDSRRPSVLVTATSGKPLGFLGGLASAEEPDADMPSELRRTALALLGDSVCRTVSLDGASYLIEAVAAAPAVVVFGAGHDAVPLVEAASSLGWDVTVVDWRPSYADPVRFPKAGSVTLARPNETAQRVSIPGGATTVIMTHNYLRDLELVRHLLASPAAYVGLLGPRRRADRILADLAANGYEPSQVELAKLHAPVGLDLGAEGAHEIALAIVAEIQAFRNGRTGAPLNGSTEPLHRRAGSVVPAPGGESPLCDLSR